MERERVRQREPEPPESIYDRILARQAAVAAETKGWEHVARGRERRWEDTPLGRIKWLTHPKLHTAMRTMAHYVLELPAGARSARVRHPWEAVGYVLSGRGHAIVNGVRYAWEPEDGLCLPSGSVYQLVNADAANPAQILWGSMLPLAQLVGLGGVEEVPDGVEPPPLVPPAAARIGGPGGPLYAAIQATAGEELARQQAGKIHIPARGANWETNRQGKIRYYTGDPILGAATRLIRMFQSDLPAGGCSGKHRHFNEAALYCLEGRGHSVVDGERCDWETGDLNIVHINSEHQHFNDDPEQPSKLLAIHSGAVGGIFDFLGQLTVEHIEESTAWKQARGGGRAG